MWVEGMFMLPQHFQQHDRYVENLVNQRCTSLRPFGYGFYRVAIDREMLRIGKLAIAEGQGVFPDGTPFCMPAEDPLPLPLEISAEIHHERVFLGLPLRQAGVPENDTEEHPEAMARFRLVETEVKDCNCGTDRPAVIQIGNLKSRLLLESDERAGYACLGLGKILETGADQQVVLDEKFIPPSLSCQAAPQLASLLRELHGLLQARGENLASRLTRPDLGGVSDTADFMHLQLMNRYQPLLRHLVGLNGVHPEAFYQLLIQLAGEMATFFQDGKLVGELPVYDHDDLYATLTPLMDQLRHYCLLDTVQRVTKIPLVKAKFGIYGARLPEENLLDHAEFILAVTAEIPAQSIVEQFPPQVKIGPGEEIQKLVRSHLPGILIEALPVAPKQLPYHAGYTYFHLQKHGDLWQKMHNSAGFAIYIGGQFPGLKLELWAIREE